MSLPRVSVLFSNGNLLQDIAAIDGIAGLCATVVTPGLIGVVKAVYNIDDAIAKGYTEAAEPFIYRHLKEFYGELNGNQELWVMGTADTQTMADVLDNTLATSAKKLTLAADGKVRLLGVARKPAAGYAAGANFIDTDVSAALTKAKVFAEARLAELRPLRILIEGRIATEASSTILSVKDADIDYAGVVLGGSLPDGTASVGLALGRAVKYGAEIKMGKVANGPLSIDTAYIGSKTVKELVNLEALHDAGFISFMSHPNKAGVYFGVDRMANTKDYRLLVYGRIVDKAAVIAAATYMEELESEIDVDADGKLSELDIAHLRGRLEQQINVAMADQISGLSILIDPNQNIINTSKLKVKLSVRPKGYATNIEVDLGLSAPVAS